MSSPNNEKKRSAKQLSVAMSAGLVFPIAIAIGYFFGLYLDRLFGTTYLYIIFLLFGIAAGFLSFYRSIADIDRATDTVEERKRNRKGRSNE